MVKYLLCIIIGIILYILLNRRNGFSVGGAVFHLRNKITGEIIHFKNKETGEIIREIESDTSLMALDVFRKYMKDIGEGLIEGVHSVEVTEEFDEAAATDSVVPVPPLLIDPSVPLVDLNKVEEDLDGMDVLQFDYLSISYNNIPGCLKYVNGDEIKLNVVSKISQGSYGIVLKYSQETPLPDGWELKTSRNNSKNKYYAYSVDGKVTITETIRPRRPEDVGKFISVAVKVFQVDKDIEERSGQNDPEIAIVQQLNSLDNYNCNTVQSKLLELSSARGGRGGFISVMEIMDGTLKEYTEQNELTIKIKLDILIQLAIIYKCLLDFDPSYYYNDSKLANILYKIDSKGKIHIVLGDLGSISKNKAKSEWSTYPSPEYMYRNTSSKHDIVWGFGTIILKLHGIDDQWIYHESNYPKGMDDYPDARKKDIDAYYTNLQTVVIPGLNITDPKLKQIVQRIFVRKFFRNINFNEIINTLTDCKPGNTFSETGLEPCEDCAECNENQNETIPCTPWTNRECSDKSCNREDFCNSHGITTGTKKESKYPDCEPCKCYTGWGGDRCDIKLEICPDETFSPTGTKSVNDQGKIIDCKPCTQCNEENQKETKRCTPWTDRECSDKSCNREDFCNNRGETSGERDGMQYPDCEPCECDFMPWAGVRCNIKLEKCPEETFSPTKYNSVDDQDKIIDCEPCRERCNEENQNETIPCTQGTNRKCSDKSCNREDFCNNHGETPGERDGMQYPDCKPCECDTNWEGDRCDTTDCSKFSHEDLCVAAGCVWEHDPHIVPPCRPP